MPKPGAKPQKEFRATYNKFRANFQCNLSNLSDSPVVSPPSNDENLREVVEQIEGELGKGNSSINDLSRKFSVSPVFIRGLAKRIIHMDVKGQGLVLIDTGRRDPLYSILRSKREVSRLQIFVEIAKHQANSAAGDCRKTRGYPAGDFGVHPRTGG